LALGLGNTLVMRRRIDPAWTLDALTQHSADALITVPILLARLVDAAAGELGTRDVSALRVIAVSGSALPAEVAYATIATPEDMRAAPGTVGRPPQGTTIKLLDESGQEVPQGTSGRIF